MPDYFLECKQVRHLGLHDKSDFDIWNFAQNNDYVIVTFDADFYDISIVKGVKPKIIWLRTGNLTTKEIAEVLVMRYSKILEFIEDEEQLCL